MTASVAAVVIVAVAVTFAIVYRDTGVQLRAAIDRDLQGDTTQLAHAVIQGPPTSAAAVLNAARRYAGTQPYGGNALLFVIVPGFGTASNHPEIRLTTPHPGYVTHPLPRVGKLRVFQMRLVVAGQAVYAGAGEPLESVEHAQHTVADSFAIAGAIALLLAIAAAYLIGSRMSAPLREMAAVAARVDGGDLGPRLDPSPRSSQELLVLADAFNHMLDRLALAFAAQRDFIADASHELRTPLTVMRGQLDLLAGEEHGADGAELRRIERLLQSEIARISRLVDDLLLLAQSDRRDFLHPADFELSEFVQELWDGLSLTATRNFEVDGLTDVRVRADPDRLAQALRNLARNAITHTPEPDGLVRIELTRPEPGTVRLAVIDDGPGVPQDARERVFERFYRTDPGRTRAAGGAGLGLAIVRAIVAAHGGRVRALAAGEAGGARFEIDLPDRS
jgi:two-component system, OmpR family, sensor kinase